MSRQQFKQFFSAESLGAELEDIDLGDGPLSTAVDELQSSCREIEQLSGALEQLGQLQEEINGLAMPSVQHYALVEQTLDQIGHGIRQDLSIPAMESIETGKLSMESFGERIRKILLWIRDRFQSLADRIRQLFSQAGDDVNYLKARHFVLYEKHRQMSGRYPKHTELSLHGIVHQVMVREGVPHDGRLLIRDATQLKSQLQTIQTQYVPRLRSVSANFIRVLDGRNFREGNFELWLKEMNDSASDMNYERLSRMLPSMLRIEDPRFPKNGAMMAPTLLGDRAIFAIDGRRGAAPADEVERATQIQNTRMVLARPNPTSRHIDENPTIASMPHSMIGEILNLVLELLTTVHKAEGENFRSEFNAISQKIDSMIRAVPAEGSATRFIDAGVRYSATMTRWVSEPYLALLAHALTTCRGMLAVSARALNAM